MNFIYINYIYIYTVNSHIAHEIARKFGVIVKNCKKKKQNKKHPQCSPERGALRVRFYVGNYCGCLPM